MSRKPGGPGGRGRTVALAAPSCPVCHGRKVLQLVSSEVSGAFERVGCPHCGAPHLGIHTYFKQGKQ